MVGWGLVSATQNRARRTESYVSLMSEMSRKRTVSRSVEGHRRGMPLCCLLPVGVSGR